MGSEPMKRLVTQFDDQRRSATVATPTCCCCCSCCCCCIASVLTSTAVTVLNVADVADQAEISGTRHGLTLAAAVLVLPVAVLCGIAAGVEFGSVNNRGDAATVAGVIVTIVVWATLLVALYRQLGLGPARIGRIVTITVIAGPALFVAELLGGAELIFRGGSSGELYLVLALVSPGLLVPLLRRCMGVRPGPSASLGLFGGGSSQAAELVRREQAAPGGDRRVRDQLETELEAARRRVEGRRDRRTPRS